MMEVYPIKTHKSILFLIISFFLISGCRCHREEKDLSDVVLKVKEGGQLVTAEYILSKIIRAKDDQTWYKIGNRNILMSCEAHIKAGVDLQQFSEDNFTVTDSVLTVTVPAARIFSLSLPPEKIKVHYQEIDLLRDPFTASEREQLLAQAETQIKQVADSLGILITAENNAALYLQTILQQAGYKQVRVHFDKLR